MLEFGQWKNCSYWITVLRDYWVRVFIKDYLLKKYLLHHCAIVSVDKPLKNALFNNFCFGFWQTVSILGKWVSYRWTSSLVGNSDLFRIFYRKYPSCLYWGNYFWSNGSKFSNFIAEFILTLASASSSRKICALLKLSSEKTRTSIRNKSYSKMVELQFWLT